MFKKGGRWLNTIFLHAQFLLQQAIKNEASDLHIHPFFKGASVSFRIHGKLHTYCSLRLLEHTRTISHFKFLAGMNTGERRIPQNGSFSNADWHYDFRVSTVPTFYGESMVIRLFPQQLFHSLDSLFVFPEHVQFFKKLCFIDFGLMVISGPTGAGKSTSVYTLLQEISRVTNRHIITIEDPIEQKIEPFIQMEVNSKAGMTFHEGLRSMLRHDPDVIFIGEIRDKETAKIAIRASLTGHLVLSTMHAATAEQVIARFLDFEISPLDVKQTLVTSICQRLICHPIYKRKSIIEYLERHEIEQLLTYPMKTLRYETLSSWMKKAEVKGWTTCVGHKKNAESF